MLADVAQTFAVILIVAAAGGYLLVLIRRSWKSGHGGACGGCHPASAPPEVSARHGVSTAQMFVPLENLQDAARRHRGSTNLPEPVKAVSGNDGNARAAPDDRAESPLPRADTQGGPEHHA